MSSYFYWLFLLGPAISDTINFFNTITYQRACHTISCRWVGAARPLSGITRTREAASAAPPGEGAGQLPSRPLSMNLGEDFFKSTISGFVLTEDLLILWPMCCRVNLPGPCIYTGPKLFSKCPNFMDSYVTLCILYLHCVPLYAKPPYLIVILQKFTPTIVHTSPSPVWITTIFC
jgi:hypothetical protein